MSRTRTESSPPPPLEVTLVRHGQAAGEQRPGELGSPLTKLGLRQAERVGKRLASETFDHIYSSDMARACGTAQAVIKHHRKTPYVVSKDIREVTGFHFFPRAPREKVVKERIEKERQACARFLRRLRKHKPGEKVLLVIHGNLIRLLISTLSDVKPGRAVILETHNTGVFKLKLSLEKGELARVNLANCVKHLTPG
ncbi:MAG: histidine phosphatase family protein, partial [Planctomycetota bacterium]|nr:histidine phosphatase family protein [Planctomycetota bacterium]